MNSYKFHVNTHVCNHHISVMKQLNYISEHYSEIARQTHIFKDEHITNRAKENLDIIGRVYDYE